MEAEKSGPPVQALIFQQEFQHYNHVPVLNIETLGTIEAAKITQISTQPDIHFSVKMQHF